MQILELLLSQLKTKNVPGLFIIESLKGLTFHLILSTKVGFFNAFGLFSTGKQNFNQSLNYIDYKFLIQSGLVLNEIPFKVWEWEENVTKLSFEQIAFGKICILSLH